MPSPQVKNIEGQSKEREAAIIKNIEAVMEHASVGISAATEAVSTLISQLRALASDYSRCCWWSLFLLLGCWFKSASQSILNVASPAAV